MCKFTINFLLWCTFFVFSSPLAAQNPDLELLKQLNGNSSVGLRDYSRFVSNTTTVVALGTPIVMGTTALLTRNDKLLKDALYVGAAIGVDGILTYGLKRTFNRNRPAITYPSEITAYASETSYSFPSGHTSLAFATATALTLKYPKWYVIAPGYLWACSVSYSRMNLGVHYPSDVLGGAILGAGSAYLTYKVNNWFWNKHPKPLINTTAFGL